MENLRRGGLELHRIIKDAKLTGKTLMHSHAYGSRIEASEPGIRDNILGASELVLSNPEIIKNTSGIYLDTIASNGGGIASAYTFASSRYNETDREPFLKSALESFFEAKWELNLNGLITPIATLAPAGDCYHAEDFPGIAEAVTLHVNELKSIDDFGENIAIVYETVSTIKQAQAIALACKLEDIPFEIRFCVGSDGYLKAGNSETISDAICVVDSISAPTSYGINCATVQDIHKSLIKLSLQNPGYLNKISGIYANSDDPCKHEKNKGLPHSTDNSGLGHSILKLSQIWEIPIASGCCGTDETHIKEIASYNNSKK